VRIGGLLPKLRCLLHHQLLHRINRNVFENVCIEELDELLFVLELLILDKLPYRDDLSELGSVLQFPHVQLRPVLSHVPREILPHYPHIQGSLVLLALTLFLE